jgi:hypothetical protein
MSDGMPDYVTEQHLILFGTIMQWFARHEVLIQEIMATVSGADVTSIKLLTTGLSVAEKHKALVNLLRHRAVPLGEIEQVRSYLEVLRGFTPLRNDIAHSVWIEGKPQNSIWPVWLSTRPRTAVRPMHDLGKNTKEFIEGDNNEATYTLNDLGYIAKALERNGAGFCECTAQFRLLFPSTV